MKRLILFLLLFMSRLTFAQVTTGSLIGTVKNSGGEFLAGATVVLTHIPSGSVYSTVSRSDGRYTIPNLRVGGPYRVRATFVGYGAFVMNNLTITLGQPLKIDISLNDDAKLLFKVTVNASHGAMISPEKNGTSTDISQRQLQDLPTISRSFQDFARFTPQANIIRGATDNSPFLVSFAGQNIQYNLITIDGAKAVNVFGFYSNGTNVNPVPLESIQEIQILLSPYDVIQGRFVGGDVNIVTKSGTNTFHGSAYTYIQNQALEGKIAGSKDSAFSNKTYGFSLGGPVLKNKLFFFTNVETTRDKDPVPFNPAQPGSGSKFNPAVLQDLRDYVEKNYNFDIGSFSGLSKTISSTAAFGRLDWNIDSKNKLTFRNSYLESENFVISRSPTDITFNNSAYSITIKSNSTSLELNSSISDQLSNVFRVSYNYVDNFRTTPAFPAINIVSGGLTYNLGSDFSSAANSLAQKDFNIVDYFTLYKGNHTITFGTDNEFYSSGSVFLPYFYGDYSYKSVAAFEANGTPANYNVGYSTAGAGDKAAANMRVGQLAVYGQDVYSINDKLKLTYGLRIDMSVFFNSPADNLSFNSSSFASAYNIATDKTPKPLPLFSPRIGFNYDVNGDRVTQLRGGAGIFTGQVPFVWLSNQFANTGVSSVTYTGVPGGLKLRYDPNQPQLGAYIPSNYTPGPAEIDVTARNFKMPQQVHANLAVDHKLPWGLTGTLEALYSKKIDDILYQNLNIGPQTGAVMLGNTTRPFYDFKRVNPAYGDVIELTNTSKGYAYNFTTQLKRQFTDGWSAMAAYTLGHSYSVNDGPRATAIFNWRTDYTVNGLNSTGEANSGYDPGSRIISYISKTFTNKNNRNFTVVGLVYDGQTGLRYSYLYTHNINGDDVSNMLAASDLVYIPTDAGQFVAFNRIVNNKTTVVTPEQQLADLRTFINDNNDLQKYVGKNTPRNGFALPWENHFDLKVSEILHVYKEHTLHIGLDIVNIGNLLNKDWGRAYDLPNQKYDLFNVATQSTSPKFSFDITKINTVGGHLRPYVINSNFSIWKALLGLRYGF